MHIKSHFLIKHDLPSLVAMLLQDWIWLCFTVEPFVFHMDIVSLFAWWCLTPLSTIIFQLYHGGQLYWSRKLEDPEKTTNLSQVN